MADSANGNIRSTNRDRSLRFIFVAMEDTNRDQSWNCSLASILLDLRDKLDEGELFAS